MCLSFYKCHTKERSFGKSDMCSHNLLFFSDKNIEGPASGTLTDIIAYIQGKTTIIDIPIHLSSIF
jgi:hypothetical protein